MKKSICSRFLVGTILASLFSVPTSFAGGLCQCIGVVARGDAYTLKVEQVTASGRPCITAAKELMKQDAYAELEVQQDEQSGRKAVKSYKAINTTNCFSYDQ